MSCLIWISHRFEMCITVTKKRPKEKVSFSFSNLKKNQEKSTWNSIETTLTWGLHTYTNPWTNSVYGVIFRPRDLNHIPRCEILFVHDRNLSIFLCTLGCPSMTSYAVTIRLKSKF